MSEDVITLAEHTILLVCFFHKGPGTLTKESIKYTCIQISSLHTYVNKVIGTSKSSQTGSASGMFSRTPASDSD